MDRRQDANVRTYLTIITLILNIAGIVWGAARLTSSVEQLNEIVKPLVVQVQKNSTDISVLQDRQQRGGE